MDCNCSISPGLRRQKTALLICGPKSSFQMKVHFAFHLEIKVRVWRKSGNVQSPGFLRFCHKPVVFYVLIFICVFIFIIFLHFALFSSLLCYCFLIPCALYLSLFNVYSNVFSPLLCSILLPQLLHRSSDCSAFSLPQLQLIPLISSSGLPVMSLPLPQCIHLLVYCLLGPSVIIMSSAGPGPLCFIVMSK
ncbi:hypothetical protein ATANTOWER_022303 [Ataeniobius toweri]|uniref:Uncharacterized protein n=1 Tax=Ataeniobius toweri TaxID=208326 RepID=A0ABU7C0U9_9TELE|nr:hypothetical protein [Ataeniobius toweri]